MIAPGYNVPSKTVEGFIANAARERGIDPNVALEVYRREGAGGWQSGVVKNGVREPSYGPFQLYTGGGLGNKFKQETGLDPSDPNTWKQNITFALDQAKKGGWSPWYGAKAAGITGFTGIDGNPQAATAPQVAQGQPALAPQQMPMQQVPQQMAALGQMPTQATPQRPAPQLSGLDSFQNQASPALAPRRVNVTGLLGLLQNNPQLRGLLQG